VRHDQCVCPASLLLRVNSTISSILDCGMLDLRPRPARTLPNFARPSCSKRERHDRTVLTVTPACSAIRTFATPSAASSSTRARCTCRNGAACDFAITANASRCPSDTNNAAAGVIIHEVDNQKDYLFWRHTTRCTAWACAWLGVVAPAAAERSNVAPSLVRGPARGVSV